MRFHTTHRTQFEFGFRVFLWATLIHAYVIYPITIGHLEWQRLAYTIAFLPLLGVDFRLRFLDNKPGLWRQLLAFLCLLALLTHVAYYLQFPGMMTKDIGTIYIVAECAYMALLSLNFTNGYRFAKYVLKND